jgi:hypothetical protein
LWKYWWSYSEELNFLQRAQSILECARSMSTNRFFAAEPKKEIVDNPRFLLGSTAFESLFEHSLTGAAQAETIKEMVTAAIALERFHRREKKYPPDLKKLVPEFLERLPIDHMDGKAMRYRPRDDGKFLLYSVGHDRVDDNGDARSPGWNNSTTSDPPRVFKGRDWVWPLPAAAPNPDGREAQTRTSSNR